MEPNPTYVVKPYTMQVIYMFNHLCKGEMNVNRILVYSQNISKKETGNSGCPKERNFVGGKLTFCLCTLCAFWIFLTCTHITYFKITKKNDFKGNKVWKGKIMAILILPAKQNAQF